MISFGFLSLMIFLGVILRKKFLLFKRLYLPASIIAGVIALIFVQLLQSLESQNLELFTFGWSSLPGILINIVFASLFLGKRLPSLRKIWRNCSRQLAYGQIVAWGQYSIGCFVVLMILKPWLEVPDVFAGIMPVGFEGGHGTAGGMGPIFDQLDCSEMKDFTLAAATFGIIFAILLGVILVNWAARKGHINHYDSLIINENESAGRVTISTDIVGALTLHLSIIGIAILLGKLIQTGLLAISTLFSEKIALLFESFPLFPLCMIGGGIIQFILDRYKYSHFICPNLMIRIQNIALDYLIVAAIAMIQLNVIFSDWIPLSLLIIAGILWNIFCILVLAPRSFKDSWFQRGIAEMGQSMGVTATGLLLLRTVDPNYKTDAASAFASKQLLHEPFMGGGLWTGLAIPLLVFYGGWIVLGITLFVIFCWSIFLLKTKY